MATMRSGLRSASAPGVEDLELEDKIADGLVVEQLPEVGIGPRGAAVGGLDLDGATEETDGGGDIALQPFDEGEGVEYVIGARSEMQRPVQILFGSGKFAPVGECETVGVVIFGSLQLRRVFFQTLAAHASMQLRGMGDGNVGALAGLVKEGQSRLEFPPVEELMAFSKEVSWLSGEPALAGLDLEMGVS